MEDLSNQLKDAEIDKAQKRLSVAKRNQWIFWILGSIFAITALFISKKLDIDIIIIEILFFVIGIPFAVYMSEEYKNAYIDLEKIKGSSYVEAFDNYERKYRPNNHFDNNNHYFD
jgi:hypothetical protein